MLFTFRPAGGERKLLGTSINKEAVLEEIYKFGQERNSPLVHITWTDLFDTTTEGWAVRVHDRLLWKRTTFSRRCPDRYTDSAD